MYLHQITEYNDKVSFNRCTEYSLELCRTLLQIHWSAMGS